METQRSFLLSPAAKALMPAEAKLLKLDESYERFKDVRWGWEGGRAQCPWCDHERVYEYATRSKFKCAKCGRQFSATSKTVFSSRKLPYSTILRAISLRIHAPANALQTSYVLGVDYRTSWRLAKTFRTFMGNIRPKVRETRWPFINSSRVEGAALVDRVNRALGYQISEQVRSDTAQDIIVAVLTGELSEDNLEADVQRYLRSHYNRIEGRYDTVALHAVMPGMDKLTWEDILSNDREHF